MCVLQGKTGEIYLGNYKGRWMMLNERKRVEEAKRKALEIAITYAEHIIYPLNADRFVNDLTKLLLQFSKEEWVYLVTAKTVKLESCLKLAVETLEEYGQHDKDCILAQWRAGRPTADGGYEMLCGYGKKEKWYRIKPVDESPECACGFTKALEEIRGEK